MLSLLSLLCLLNIANAQYTPPRRWGQATLLVNTNLYVHGGKTDQYNEQSYTAAPDSNDLLYLDLTSTFSTSSVPWVLLSSDNSPAIAWHTISALNTSLALSFGGQTDANSPTALPDQPDSAELLNVGDTTKPQWINVDNGYASEPGRRMRHTADTLPNGNILIIGGQKTDGSGTALADNYLFDISIPQFSSFNSSSQDGPGDIYGHASIIVPDDFVVVFGGSHSGSSSNALIPLNTIWVVSVKTPIPFWFPLSLNGTTYPSPRIGFASVLLPDGRILIHGGSDGSVNSALSDGWFLTIDFITSRTASWSQATGLDSLGARRDHFAICAGGSVIFGFGYGSNGPADAGVQIYDPVAGTMGGTYTPPPSSSTRTLSPTLPGPSGTDASGGGSGSSTASPTPTVTPGTGGGNGDGGNGGGGDGNGGGGGGDGNGGGGGKTTGIAVGVTLGVLALLAAGTGTALYLRRQRRHQRFASQFARIDDTDPDLDPNHPNHPYDDGDGDGYEYGDGYRQRHSPHSHSLLSHHSRDIPTAHPYGYNPAPTSSPYQGRIKGIFGTLGLSALTAGVGMGKHKHGGERYGAGLERKDMLADEDTRQFGYPASASASASAGANANAWSRYKNTSGGSTWSFMSALTGGRHPSFTRGQSYNSARSRDASMASANASVVGVGTASAVGTPWGEKGDPFSDGSALVRDERSGYVGAVAPSATKEPGEAVGVGVGVVGTAAALGATAATGDGVGVGARGAARPGAGRRQMSQTSARSVGGVSYTDPFADPIAEESRESESPLLFNNIYHNNDSRGGQDTQTQTQAHSQTQTQTQRRHPPSSSLYSDYPPPALTLATLFPGMERHALSPLSEATSRYSLSDRSNASHSSHSQSHDHTSLATTQTNLTSYDHGSQPHVRVGSPKHTSMVDAQSKSNAPPPTRGVARSDSWWNRFSKSSFLDRSRSSHSHSGLGPMASSSSSSFSRRSHSFDIRDPNPPPVRISALSAIEEKSSHHSASPESQKSREKTPPSAGEVSARRKNSLYNSVVHGKSSSSVRTAGTADTAAIERMGGMDVVQRLATGSTTSTSMRSASERSRGTRSSVGSSLDEGEGEVRDHERRRSFVDDLEPQMEMVASPVDMHTEQTTAPPAAAQTTQVLQRDFASSANQSGSPSPHQHPEQDRDQEDASTQASTSHPSINTFGRPSPTRRMSNLISSRVGEFEERLAREGEVLPLTNTRAREERVNRRYSGGGGHGHGHGHGGKKTSVSYGLVPKASLFVANPDAGGSGSGKGKDGSLDSR